MHFTVEVGPNNLSEKKLNEFLEKSDTGNIFSSIDIYTLFNQTLNWQPKFLYAKDESNKLQAVILYVIQKEKTGMLGYFTSRAIVFAGPVINDNLEKRHKFIVLELMLKELVRLTTKKSIYIQFRNLFSLDEYMPLFKKFEFKYHKHLNFKVTTLDENKLFSKISKSKKRQIKQSLNNGASIIEPKGIEQVKEFYQLLKDLYKEKIKRPLPDWTFFKAFFEQSNAGKLGKYFLINFDNKIIGGIMCPITAHKCIYEWYICGMDGKFKGIYPSVLATWAAIEYALKNNLKYFDFMGAGKPDQDYGVREFKAKFGGELVEYGRYERINNRFLYNLGKMGLKILSLFK